MSNTTATPAGGRILAFLAALCRSAAILLLALVSILIVAQVVGRNLFDVGMPWADELSRFSGVALVFLCVPILALRGQHVSVDMVPAMLSPAGRRACAVIAEAMVLAFAAFSLWGLYAFLGRAWKFATPTLGIPNWVYYTPAVIGFALLATIAAVRLSVLLRGGDLTREEAPLS